MINQKDWADSSDSEDDFDYENIALMAVSSSKAGSPKSSQSASSTKQVSLFSLDVRTRIFVIFKNLINDDFVK